MRKGFVSLRRENITTEPLVLNAEITSNQQSAISSQQEQETITSDNGQEQETMTSDNRLLGWPLLGWLLIDWLLLG
jgi:hypothetical protein